MTGSAPAPRTWRDPGGAAARCSSPALPRSLRSPAAAAAADVDGSWTDASADAAGRARRQWLPRGPGHAPMRLESGGGSCSDAMPARFIRQSGAIRSVEVPPWTSGWHSSPDLPSASARRTVPQRASLARPAPSGLWWSAWSAIGGSRLVTNRAAVDGPSTACSWLPTLVLAAYGGTHVSPNQSDATAPGLPPGRAWLPSARWAPLTRRWDLAAFAVTVGLVHGDRQAGSLVPAHRGVLAGADRWRSVRRKEGWDVARSYTPVAQCPSSRSWFADRGGDSGLGEPSQQHCRHPCQQRCVQVQTCT